MKKFLKGFTYAFKGFRYAFSTQLNFKIHSFVAVIVIFAGIYLHLDIHEWLWISLAIGMILVAELLNTALEVFVDLISPDYHPKAGIIKDISAAAVLLTVFIAVLIGLFIFVPKLI